MNRTIEAPTTEDHGTVTSEYRSEHVESDESDPIFVDMYGARIDGRCVSLDTVVSPKGYAYLRVNGTILFE